MRHPLRSIPIKDWWQDPRLRAIHEAEGWWSIRTTGSHDVDLRFGNIHLTYDTVRRQPLPFLHYDRVDPTTRGGLLGHFIIDVLPGPVDLRR